MKYHPNLLFDIETLVNTAQPTSILFIGNHSHSFLDNYLKQKKLLGQECVITSISIQNIDSLSKINKRFDVGIALDIFEHLTKTQGQQLIARLRDVLCPQYCIALPVVEKKGESINDNNDWHIREFFAFALKRVAFYSCAESTTQKIGLFKYNINDYKQTPEWLNADNWANPNHWNKYRW